MSKTRYLAAPLPSTRMPGGIPYIVGNEAAERFSFYGMKTILMIFMMQYLLDAHGAEAPMTESEAKAKVHLFVSFVYLTPLLGAVVSDAFLGKYRTIISLSIVYCLGHLVLALDPVLYRLKPMAAGTLFEPLLVGYHTRIGLATGLFLIGVGAGGIKPCVSAHVGDQFGTMNQHLLEKVFGWFYFAINFGAFFSTLLTPWLREEYGPGVAFGVPGVLMFLATVIFWMGRNKFVHVPPGGIGAVREALSGEGLRAIRNLCLIYVFVAVFWSLFDQTASAWVAQANNMDRRWEVVEWFPTALHAQDWLPVRLQSVTWYPDQIQAVNPILVLLFIPLFSYVVYPLLDRIVTMTPLRKVGLGFFVMVAAFAISGWIETQIEAGKTPDIAWQFLAYVVLTSAEVLVSITCLEFSYTQAPKKTKSFIMSLYMLSVSAGNAFAYAVNDFNENADGTLKLDGPNYYWFFTGVMLAAAVLFIGASQFYRGRTYIQGEGEKDRSDESE